MRGSGTTPISMPLSGTVSTSPEVRSTSGGRCPPPAMVRVRPAVALRADHAEHHGGEPALAVRLGRLQQRVVEQPQQPAGCDSTRCSACRHWRSCPVKTAASTPLPETSPRKNTRAAVGEPVRAVEVAADAQPGLRRPVRGAPLHARRPRPARPAAGWPAGCRPPRPGRGRARRWSAPRRPGPRRRGPARRRPRRTSGWRAGRPAARRPGRPGRAAGPPGRPPRRRSGRAASRRRPPARPASPPRAARPRSAPRRSRPGRSAASSTPLSTVGASSSVREARHQRARPERGAPAPARRPRPGSARRAGPRPRRPGPGAAGCPASRPPRPGSRAGPLGEQRVGAADALGDVLDVPAAPGAGERHLPGPQPAAAVGEAAGPALAQAGDAGRREQLAGHHLGQQPLGDRAEVAHHAVGVADDQALAEVLDHLGPVGRGLALGPGPGAGGRPQVRPAASADHAGARAVLGVEIRPSPGSQSLTSAAVTS